MGKTPNCCMIPSYISTYKRKSETVGTEIIFFYIQAPMVDNSFSRKIKKVLKMSL